MCVIDGQYDTSFGRVSHSHVSLLCRFQSYICSPRGQKDVQCENPTLQLVDDSPNAGLHCRLVLMWKHLRFTLQLVLIDFYRKKVTKMEKTATLH